MEATRWVMEVDDASETTVIFRRFVNVRRENRLD